MTEPNRQENTVEDHLGFVSQEVRRYLSPGERRQPVEDHEYYGEALLAIWEVRDRYDPTYSYTTFLATVIRGRLSNEINKVNRRGLRATLVPLAGESYQNVAEPEERDNSDAEARLAEVREAVCSLTTLSPGEREAMLDRIDFPDRRYKESMTKDRLGFSKQYWSKQFKRGAEKIADVYGGRLGVMTPAISD